MERFEPKSERIITQEEREYLNRVLGSFGLYDASQDECDTPEHQDERWAVEEYDNPCILRSED